MIDILVPVLSRPQNAAPLVASIKETTTVPYSVLFLCSPGDAEQIAACRNTNARIQIVPWEVGRSEYPKKMNLGHRVTKGEFMLMAADDVTFQPYWDIRALEVAERTGAGVIGTNDCANKQVMRGGFSTHALVRRSYVDERGASLDGPGILMSLAYDHNYCDRELCHLAEHRGLWAFAADSRIQHRHPVWHTAKDDSTYIKGRSTASEDHITFFLRCDQWGYAGILPQERQWLRRARRRLDNVNARRIEAAKRSRRL